MINKHNPDVLSCLANLSNDEVFTPPEVVNRMLDMLPQELFESTETTFLDPCCKTGVFLREIAKRLLANQMPGYEQAVEEINAKKANCQKLSPDEKWFMNQLQHSIDHIFHNQLFGIAITEMTSLVSRRSVYCSKWPNGEYSVSKFDNPEGNIRFKRINHTWVNGKCKYCGASEEQYSRGDALETHAYEWIHTENPEGIFNMKFDVIISNPPYQLSDGGNAASASPIYHLFVNQAKKLKPRYVTMIIPARWYTGGKGLDKFRDSMLNDNHIRSITDYVNSKECFGSLSIGGGVCYFLWDRDHSGLCNFRTINTGIESCSTRKLNEFPVFVRYNEAVGIIHKVLDKNEPTLDTILTSRNPFGIPTSARGNERRFKNSYTLISSQGEGFISERDIESNKAVADSYKVMITRIMSEHAGEPDKEGMLVVLATVKVLEPHEVCTDSYIVGGCYKSKKMAENLADYLRSKFTRFLLLQAAASINLSKTTYQFVPLQDFSKSWTDAELYKKYKLTQDEINFIESMIRPMDKEDA